MPDGTSTAHLYRPKIVTTLREGYTAGHFRQDALAAITVAIVALPLSMAIAVASGVTPERGLTAAIIGGALVSGLGGSRFQIGGPAGAFIVLVATTVHNFGLDGLLLAVFLSGLFLSLLGLVGLGTLIRYIPHPVTVGFTCGIAVTILAGQVRDLTGIVLAQSEPGPLIPKLIALLGAIETLNPMALSVGLGTASLIFVLRHFKPNWPGMLITVGLTSVVASIFYLPIETIGSRFGQLSSQILSPQLPVMSYDLILQILPVTISFTLLGGIESLLSAKIADGMTGRKHRSNMELVAQGIANIGSALFGGISVTGTIARTATNIRAGAHSPISGIMHSALLLVFLLVAAPLGSYVPLSALAGILVVVCWNMAERREFLRLLHNWRSACVLLTTFGFTIIRDLTTGIIVGCAAAAILAMFGKGVAREDV